MKKRKLNLHRETIRRLHDADIGKARGGGWGDTSASNNAGTCCRAWFLISWIPTGDGC